MVHCSRSKLLCWKESADCLPLSAVVPSVCVDSTRFCMVDVAAPLLSLENGRKTWFSLHVDFVKIPSLFIVCSHSCELLRTGRFWIPCKTTVTDIQSVKTLILLTFKE